MAITLNTGYDNSPHKKANPIERGTVYSGTAMSFDGSNDYVNLGNSLILKPNGTISISVWFKRDALGTRHIITTTGNHDSSEEGAWLSIEANNKIGVMIGNTSGQGGYDTTTTLDDIGIWHHLVLTHTGTTSIVYLDGKLFHSGTTGALLHNTASPTDVYIGNGVNMTDEFAGDLSDFRIWDVALSLAQIQEMYKEPELIYPTGITESSGSLRGRYLLNEGAGFTALDSHKPSGEKKFGETSIVFDGTGDYLSLPDSSDWDFDTGDWTVECWMKPTVQGLEALFEFGTYNGGGMLALFQNTSDNDIKFYFDDGGSGGNIAVDGTSAGISLDAWTHVALVHASGTVTAYINGTSAGSLSATPDISPGTRTFKIGTAVHSGSYDFTGYLDDVRITKGLAVYTGAFTAPTSALATTWSASTGIAANTDASKVKLLIHGDNSKNRPATGIVDSSPSSHTITAEGGAKLTDYRSHGTVNGAIWDTGNNEIYQTGLVKGSGTVYFDGNADYVTFPNIGDMFGDNFTGDITFSIWFQQVYGNGNDGLFTFANSHGHYPNCNIYSNDINFNLGSPASQLRLIHSLPSTDTDWHHGVFVFTASDKDTCQFFMDGLPHTSTQYTAFGGATDWDLAGKSFILGKYYADGYGWTGNIGETAIWDKALSQSEAVTLYNNGIPYDATNVQSGNLQGYWRNDGVAVWSDRSTKTSFGTSAIYFDGNDDLEFAHNSGIEFGADPFTLEMNIRFDAGFANEAFMSVHGYTMADRMFSWDRYNNKFSFYAYDSDNTSGVSYINDAWYPNANRWYHLAMVRNGADVKFYIDGTQFGSTYNIGSASMADGGYPLKIGVATSTAESPTEYSHFTGYMDGIRISKGVARYTSNFTKPSEAFEDDSYTSFLLNGGVLTDESSNSISITNSGDTSIVSNLDTTFANDGTVSGTKSIVFLPEGSTADKDILGFPLQDTVADVLSLNDPAYFEIPQNADFAFGSKDFTVEFWINIKELETGVLIGNAWGSDIDDRAGWSIYWNKSDTSLYLGWSNTVTGSWAGDHAKSWTPDLNTWIHFHLVRSGSTFTFYENNSVITSSFTDSDPFPTELTHPFRIGADPDNSAANFFNASFDEVRVYHKALSSAERIQNYNHGAVAHGKTVIE